MIRWIFRNIIIYLFEIHRLTYMSDKFGDNFYVTKSVAWRWSLKQIFIGSVLLKEIKCILFLKLPSARGHCDLLRIIFIFLQNLFLERKIIHCNDILIWKFVIGKIWVLCNYLALILIIITYRKTNADNFHISNKV